MRVHTEFHNSGQKMLSIAHNRLAKRGKSWKDHGFPKKHPDMLEKVKTFTNMTSRTTMTGTATGSSMSRQIALNILSPDLVRKVMNLLKMKESDMFEEEGDEDDQEEDLLQSQDFSTFTQSQGGDTVRVCKICPYQTQNHEELEMHLDSHPTCAECGKRCMNHDNLKNHQEEHVKFKCNVCGNEVLSKEKADHIEMHVRQDLFKKTLENGKTLKKPKAKTDLKTATGYNVFVKTNHSKLKDQNPGLTTDQLRKLVAAEWKSLGVVGQQAYKELARNSGEVRETQASRTDGVSQGRTNQLNRITPDADQGRIHACNLCGVLYSGMAELENHKLVTHSTAGPSPQSQAAVAAEVIAVVDAADAAAVEVNRL